MGKRAEQISKQSSAGMRKQAKKDAKRARRRAERRDPENAAAATRYVLRGWAD
jgi:hypothetical protein